MAYDNLIEKLTAHGEKDLRVKKAVIVKFGHLLLAQAVVPADCEFPITKREDLSEEPFEFPKEIAPPIHASFKDHPNVFDPETLQKMPEFRWGDRFGFFIYGDICRYRIHLPKAKQRYKEFMDTEEHFSVLCDGSMFAAYSEIEDIPTFSNIGHEFRELARTQIESKTPFKSPSLGPCPIHPDIVIVFREPDEDSKGESASSGYLIEDDIVIVTTEKRSTSESVLHCFWDFRSPIQDFYRHLAVRKYLIDCNDEVGNHFRIASTKVRELVETPSWKVWKTHAASRQARISIASVHERLVEIEDALLDYESDRIRDLEGLRKSREASYLHDYFKEITEADVNVTPSLGSALTFFEGELQLYGNIRSLLYASLIGAVVGSLLTGVLTRLIH